MLTRGFRRDAHLWAESYDRELQDIFAVQDEITQQVVTALEVKVMEAEMARVRRTPTNNLTAYDYSLRGDKYYDLLTKEGHEQARQMYEKAIALDPQYAEVYVMLGWSYWLESLWQWSEGPQAMERAFTLAQQAITLDNSLAGAHMLLGGIYLWWDRQYERAVAEGEQGLVLDPNCGTCAAFLGHILTFAGRPQEAVSLIEKGMRLDPCCTEFNAIFLAEAYLFLERYEDAIAPAIRSLSYSSDSQAGHLVLTVSYSKMGQEEKARAAAAEVLRVNPKFSVEVHGQMLPAKDRVVVERHLAALRKAGLK
jgi:adenylate cyclase